MAKYAEGAVPYTGVFNVDVSASELNAANLQLATMLGPQTMNIPLIGVNDSVNVVLANWTWFTGATNPPFWQTGTDGSSFHIPIPWVRTGMKITGLYVNTQGDYQGDGASEGVIKLIRHLVNYAGTGPAAWSDVAGAACTGNFFRGIGGPFTPTWATYNAGALTSVLDATYSYALSITSSNGGTMAACRVLGAWATVQMGN